MAKSLKYVCWSLGDAHSAVWPPKKVEKKRPKKPTGAQESDLVTSFWNASAGVPPLAMLVSEGAAEELDTVDVGESVDVDKPVDVDESVDAEDDESLGEAVDVAEASDEVTSPSCRLNHWRRFGAAFGSRPLEAEAEGLVIAELELAFVVRILEAEGDPADWTNNVEAVRELVVKPEPVLADALKADEVTVEAAADCTTRDLLTTPVDAALVLERMVADLAGVLVDSNDVVETDEMIALDELLLEAEMLEIEADVELEMSSKSSSLTGISDEESVLTQVFKFSRYRTSLALRTRLPLIQMLKPPSLTPGVLSQISCRIVVQSPLAKVHAPLPIDRP